MLFVLKTAQEVDAAFQLQFGFVGIISIGLVAAISIVPNFVLEPKHRNNTGTMIAAAIMSMLALVTVGCSSYSSTYGSFASMLIEPDGVTVEYFGLNPRKVSIPYENIESVEARTSSPKGIQRCLIEIETRSGPNHQSVEISRSKNQCQHLAKKAWRPSHLKRQFATVTSPAT